MNTAMVLFGALTLLSAVGVVFSTRPLHSATWLVVTLFLVAVHFALLGADFLAAVQVLVYAGAIMVLVIFVIMLLGLDTELGALKKRSLFNFISAGFVGVFVAAAVWSVESGRGIAVWDDTGSVTLPDGFGSTEVIGKALVTDYLFAFELASVLLLAAVIASVMLALDPKRPLPPGRGLRAVREAEARRLSEVHED